VIGVGDDHDHASVGIFGLEALHAEEMDVPIFAGNDRGGVWAQLVIGALEAERLVESNGLIEVAAGQHGVGAFVRHFRFSFSAKSARSYANEAR
jgi:hypothetical protein